MSLYHKCSGCNQFDCVCGGDPPDIDLPDNDERHYPCEECNEGILTILRHGKYVTGECSCCRHQVDYELPDEALMEEK